MAGRLPARCLRSTQWRIGPFSGVRDISSPQIDTERLILTPMTVDDVEAYLELHSDPDVIRFLGEMDRGLAVARLESDARLWAGRGHGLFRLAHKDDGRFLGRVGLKYWPQFDETEVGWTLRRGEWGHGFATEAARACGEWAFRELSVPYLTSYIEPHNARSIAVAERLGMSPLRRDALDGIAAVGDRVLDGIRVVVYAITREDWARLGAV
jgi:RimJ/RimL family protein N-acetyltransferase